MRRIPGPVSRLSQDRDHTNTDNISNLSLPTTTEVICSPVQSHHCLMVSALRSLFCLSSDDLSRDVKDILRTFHLAPISDVQEGLHDLVIAGLVAVIEEVSVAYDGSVSLSLQDGTGGVNGFLSPEEMARLQQAFPKLALLICPGNVIFLQGVAIYVAKNPFQRLLSITHRNITSIVEGERRKRRTDSD